MSISLNFVITGHQVSYPTTATSISLVSNVAQGLTAVRPTDRIVIIFDD